MPPGRRTAAAPGGLGRAGPSQSEMELLRACTHDEWSASAAWHRWIATHAVDDASDRSVGLLAAVAANVPAAALGVEAERLRGLRRRNWADTQLRLESVHQALDVLAVLDTAPIVTGGLSQLTTVAGQGGARPLGSADLVLGDTAVDAARLLDARGWTRSRPTASPFDHIIDMFDSVGNVIRLHRWVLFPRLAAVPERAWSDRASTHEVAGRVVRRFRLADELVAGVVLGVMASPSALLRWPLDVVDIADAGPTFEHLDPDSFWDQVLGSARDVGAGPILGGALSMCRTELGASVPAGLIDELGASPLDRQLARQWTLRRAGLTIEWRSLRYRRLAHEAGRAATPWGYLQARAAAAQASGIGPATRARIARAEHFVNGLRRD